MKIMKQCTQEIIQYEKLDDVNYIKKQFTLDGVLKREKELNINNQQVGNRYMLSTEQALNYLVNNQGYHIIEE